MSSLVIDPHTCIGCEKCLSSCQYSALTMQDGFPLVQPDQCVLCGLCVDSCPVNAISIQVDHAPVKDKSMDYHGIFVYMEHGANGLLPVGKELLGAGKTLSKQQGCNLSAIIVGHQVRDLAAEAIAYGAEDVYLYDAAALASPLEEVYTTILFDLIQDQKPEILLFGATGWGRSLAPRLAARLQTGLTADCTHLSMDQETGLLQQTRPAFGGNLMATILCPFHRPQMATVRPGVLQQKEPDHQALGAIHQRKLPMLSPAHVQILEEGPLPHKQGIEGSNIIVVAGRGIGNKKNMRLIQAFAEQIGGVFGVTRPLVESGWAEQSHQIGQTGTAVAPDLLLAFGVSGAIQHLAGIGNAKTIVAINTDPEAPIFHVAHYKIIGDCIALLQELIHE